MTRRALLVAALALAPRLARADDRVLFLREQGATATPPPGTTLLPTDPLAPSRHAETARAALVAARERFLASAFREAATGLHAAAAETVEHLVRDDRPLAVELLHWAAACSLLAGDRDVARDDFRRALLIAPEARPPSVFPPEVEAFFEEVRAAAVVATPTVFVVRSVPAGARVEINGRDEGVTPVTVRLAPGVHALRLERLGYRLWVGPLRVEPGALPDPQIVLTEARGPELRAQLARPDGLQLVPDEATLARIRAEYQVDRVMIALRDGTQRVHPPPPPNYVPYVVGGAALGAAILGVTLWYFLRPPPVVEIGASGG
jgi:hypothetical protein